MIDELDIQNEIDITIRDILGEMEDKCKILFQEAIQRNVYDAYQPKVYDRTNQLKDKVKTELTNSGLSIYVDIDNMYYFSAVNKKRIVTLAVPWFVQEGHMSRHTELKENQYNNYEGRKYLEMAKQLIDKEFGIDVKIINEKPSWV